jgi:hypothetical protein
MKTTICVASLLMGLVACGGSDTSGLLDGSANDTGTGADGSPTSDGGPTNDGAPTSDGAPTNDGAATDGAATDGGAFNPANVSGLVLWLEGNIASSITQANGHVTVWADQTSHHNDAKGSTTNSARNPTVKTGQINSLDVVHFNKGQTNGSGNMLVVADNSDKSLQWGTGDFYVAIVGEFDNDPMDSNGTNFACGNFFAKNIAQTINSFTGVAFYGNIPPANNGNPAAGLLYMTANSLNNFVFTGTAYNNNNPHVFGLRRQGTKIDLFVDGSSVASATTTTNVDVSNAGVAIRIGADGDANLLRLDGDIGEVYAVAGALSASDQTSIQAYLKNKWKTP